MVYVKWYASLVLLFTIFHYNYGTEQDNKITIQYWEYCAGCKATVEVFTGVASLKLAEIEKKHAEGSGESSLKVKLKAKEIAENLCNNKYFDGYKPFIRHSCQKIMMEDKQVFLSPFHSRGPDHYKNSPGNLYQKSHLICGQKLNACDESVFQKGNLPQNERTECNACRIIAEDLELILHVVKHTSTSSLVETICASLGYSHQPYTWIENICEELVEEHSKKIIEVTNKYSKFIRSGKPLESRLANDLCSEILSCNDFYTEEGEDGYEEGGLGESPPAYVTEAAVGRDDAGLEF